MKTSDSVVAIAKALLSAQRSIKFAQTDAANPYFKSKYADLPTVIDAIKPQLNANEIVYIQTPSPSESGTLALTTRLLHVSGEWIEDTAIVPLPKADPQGYGSAMTYARRYSLASITGLYQDDDDGNAASVGGKQSVQMPRAKSTVQVPAVGVPSGDKEIEFVESPAVEKVQKALSGKASDKQRAMIFAKCKSAGITEDELRSFLREKWKIESTKDLSWKNIDDVLAWIKAFSPDENETTGN